jgi:hypothetical protein
MSGLDGCAPPDEAPDVPTADELFGDDLLVFLGDAHLVAVGTDLCLQARIDRFASLLGFFFADPVDVGYQNREKLG